MIYIAVFAGDPSYIWCVVFCCIISPGVPVMSGMQDICSSDSTSVPQGVGRLDNCSVHSRTPLERVNITPHHRKYQEKLLRRRNKTLNVISFLVMRLSDSNRRKVEEQSF